MRLTSLSKEDLNPDLQSLAKSYGAFQTWISVAGHAPELTEAIFDLLKTQSQHSSLDPRLVELAALAVSQANACPYCIEQHSNRAKSLGLSEEQLSGLLEPESESEFTPLEWLVIQYAKQISLEVHKMRDALVNDLKEHLCEKQLVELTWRISFMNAFNRFNDALKIPPEA